MVCAARVNLISMPGSTLPTHSSSWQNKAIKARLLAEYAALKEEKARLKAEQAAEGP